MQIQARASFFLSRCTLFSIASFIAQLQFLIILATFTCAIKSQSSLSVSVRSEKWRAT
jgi:hypothetical protein